jgi:hypothetical protein
MVGPMPFPADSVRRHAAAVDAIAADVEQARGAAAEVTMDTQAYGMLCQFLPALLMPAGQPEPIGRLDLAVSAPARRESGGLVAVEP